MEKLIGVKEAAEQLMVSITTIRRLVKAGDLRCVRVGNALRFNEKCLADFIDKNTSESRKR